MVSKYSKVSENNFLLVTAILFILLSLYLIKDIFFLIIFSLILSFFLFPVYSFINKRIINKQLSSILTLFSATMAIFIPIILLSYFLILNLIKLVVEYKEYLEDPQVLNESISIFINKFTNSSVLSDINFSNFLSSVVNWILNFSKDFFSSIPISLFNFFIIMFISYYVLIYNKKLLKATNEYLPISFKRQEEIMINLSKNLKVLFGGYFFTALIQTFVAFIGYLIFGTPNLLIITTITLFVSLIPYLGTPLVWVPISLFMIISGNEAGGIGLLIYGTLIITTIDNFMRPILMSSKDTISPPLVFIGFLGGMFAFGILGIILGPIIISITSIFLRYLKETYEISNN